MSNERVNTDSETHGRALAQFNPNSASGRITLVLCIVVYSANAVVHTRSLYLVLLMAEQQAVESVEIRRVVKLEFNFPAA